MYADMPQPSQRIFSPLTLPILKTIISLQTFSVHSTEGRTLESSIIYFYNHEDSHISQDGEDSNACGMVVHSGLYIPVSSRIHPSLLVLVIICPVLALTHTHEP